MSAIPIPPRPFDWIVPVLILLVAGCSAAIDYQTDKYPHEFVTHAYGSSMLPDFPAGGLVKVVRIPYDDLVLGVTVIYVNPFVHVRGGVVNHRLYQKSGDNWVAKGDNNSRKDVGLVTRFNYIGVTSPLLP